jgi:hypothetical protein
MSFSGSSFNTNWNTHIKMLFKTEFGHWKFLLQNNYNSIYFLNKNPFNWPDSNFQC